MRVAPILALGVFVAALAGCAVGPNYRTPKTETPEGFAAAGSTATAGDGGNASGAAAAPVDLTAWWHALKDPELDSLIALGILNRVKQPGWRVSLACPDAQVRSMNGVLLHAPFHMLQGQNVQVASGVLNQPPVASPMAFQVTVRTLGRLSDVNEFSNVVVKTTSSAVVRLRDVARV